MNVKLMLCLLSCPGRYGDSKANTVVSYVKFAIKVIFL